MPENTQQEVDAAVIALKDAHQKSEGYREAGGGVKVKQVIEAPRVTVWDRQGRTSRVPLTALTYHMTKTDRDGNRVFFDRPPEGMSLPEPIERTCEICLPKGVRKLFYSEYDYDGHMGAFHPREFAIMREREAAASNSIIGSVVRMNPEERNALKALLGTEKSGTVEAAAYPCDCGFQAKSAFGLKVHQKKHKK